MKLDLKTRKILIFLVSYTVWTTLFQWLGQALITYFMRQSGSSIHEISDVFASNAIILASIGSAAYLFLLTRIPPYATTELDNFLPKLEFEKNFVPGFLRGSATALIFVMVFVVIGLYRYLGSLVSFDEAYVSLFNVVLRLIALLILVYCEEFFFREKLLQIFLGRYSAIGASIICSLLFSSVKEIQFDLGARQFLTVFLISYSLSLRAISKKSFIFSAGILSGFLIVLHAVMSLPVYGNEFQGIFLIQYRVSPADDTEWLRYFTGGPSGPMSSVAFQIILLFDAIKRSRPLIAAQSSK